MLFEQLIALGVYVGGGLSNLPFENQIGVLEQYRDGFIQHFLLFSAGAVQYEISHTLLQVQAARVANADACAPELVAAQMCVHVFQAIVPRVAAPLFDFNLPWQQIKLVMGDQNLPDVPIETTAPSSAAILPPVP